MVLGSTISICLGVSPSPRVRCLLACFTYLDRILPSVENDGTDY